MSEQFRTRFYVRLCPHSRKHLLLSSVQTSSSRSQWYLLSVIVIQTADPADTFRHTKFTVTKTTLTASNVSEHRTVRQLFVCATITKTNMYWKQRNNEKGDKSGTILVHVGVRNGIKGPSPVDRNRYHLNWLFFNILNIIQYLEKSVNMLTGMST